METKIEVTKTQLIEAVQKYYHDVMDKPQDFEAQLDGSIEQATDTVEHLLTFL